MWKVDVHVDVAQRDRPDDDGLELKSISQVFSELNIIPRHSATTPAKLVYRQFAGIGQYLFDLKIVGSGISRVAAWRSRRTVTTWRCPDAVIIVSRPCYPSKLYFSSFFLFILNRFEINSNLNRSNLSKNLLAHSLKQKSIKLSALTCICDILCQLNSEHFIFDITRSDR